MTHMCGGIMFMKSSCLLLILSCLQEDDVQSSEYMDTDDDSTGSEEDEESFVSMHTFLVQINSLPFTIAKTKIHVRWFKIFEKLRISISIVHCALGDAVQ